MFQPAENKIPFSMKGLAEELLKRALRELTSGQEFKLLLPVPETARVLNTNERMIRELIARGIIPSLKIGRKVLVPVIPLLSWIEAQAGRPHNEQAAANVFIVNPNRPNK